MDGVVDYDADRFAHPTGRSWPRWRRSTDSTSWCRRSDTPTRSAPPRAMPASPTTRSPRAMAADRTDGLRSFPGPIADNTTAAPWTVPDDVSPAVIWAALDCPGGWAVIGAGRPAVLGRH